MLRTSVKDLGLDAKIELYCDSSSARAFAARRGIGKQRHIQTRYLWLQERVALKHLRICKVSTHENPADLFTKQLDKVKLEKFSKMLGQRDIR